MKEPFISVIIINYKKPKDSILSIKSVLNQGYKKCEVIFIDDNSPDDSLKKIKRVFAKIKFPNVKIVGLKKALGRAAWNEGMKRAQGDIFLLLDADMYLTKNFLKLLAKKFVKYPNIYAVTFNLKHPRLKTRGWEPVHSVYPSLDGGYEAYTATFAIRREVFEKVGGYDPNFFLYVENEYYIKLLQQGFRVYYFPDLIAYHTESANPYRSVMLSYHVVKNYMQLYALYLPLSVWPKFFLHHQKEFREVVVGGKANRLGAIKGLVSGIWFFLKALPKRRVLQGDALDTFMRFYFPQKGDVVVEKWGWGRES